VVLRPTKSVSVLSGLGMRPPEGRCWPPTMPESERRSPTWTEHLGARRGHGGHQYVSGQGGAGGSASTIAPAEKATRCCTPIWWWQPRPGAGRTLDRLDGRDLYRHRLAADAIYRATYQRQLSRSLGVEWTVADRHGNRELHGMPEEVVRLTSKRTEQSRARWHR
jgi:hypothetical protein